MNFKDKIIWITGASSGIGKSLAYEFADRGAKVIISSEKKEELAQVKEEIDKQKKTCFYLPFNLENTEEILNAVETVKKEFKHVDVLINNGGISQRSLIEETNLDIDRKIMEINFFGGVTLTKALLPVMIQNGGGHIAVTTSIAGKFGVFYRSAYCASKHALYGFYETLRLELENKNIKVTIACPGRVQTNISVGAITKNGTTHGKMDKGQAEGISPGKCAKIYIKAIEKNKKEVLIGGKELLMVYIKRFFPYLFYKIIKKINPT